MSSRGPDGRRKALKKGYDADESRRKRTDKSLEIRKQKREETLKKRRDAIEGGGIDAQNLEYAQKPEEQSFDPDLRERVAEIPSLCNAVFNGTIDEQRDATMKFRKLLSHEHNPPINAIIESGVVPQFVRFLVSADESLQFEAAWALTNIASGTADDTRVVIDHGAVPIFVQLLSSPNSEVKEQAVWALGNIAGDSHECRDMVLQCQALQPLLAILSCDPPPKMTMLRNATWTLSNFCRGKPQPDFGMVSPSIPVLARLLNHVDEEVLTDACWALSYLSDGENMKIQAVIDSGVTRRLVELLMHHNTSVQTPALRTVGNIVTGDDSQTQAVINCSVLMPLLQLLNHPKKSIRKEACWTVSNITAGSRPQIQAVIDANIIPALVNLLSTAEYEVKKEAAWAISNATSGGSDQQIHALVEKGCIKPLCDLLTVFDARILSVALEAIENILKAGEKNKQDGENPYVIELDEADGITKIENLQDHNSQEIYEKCGHIVRKYIGVEEEEPIDQAPVGNDGRIGFGAVDPNNMGQFQF